MSHFDSTSPFSPVSQSQFRLLEDNLPTSIPSAFGGGTVYRSVAPLELGAPFLPKPSPGNKDPDGEGDFALGIQPSKADSFGLVGLIPRSAGSAEVPLVPAWVSVHTSFVLCLPPVAAFTKILEILRSSTFGIKVDVQAQDDKFQLKGKGVRDQTMTYFKKKLFRNSANEIIVECTRQDGCVVLFNKVYQKLLAALGSEARRLVDTGLSATPSPLSNTQSFLSLPPSLSSSEAPSSSLLRTLLLRAESQFLDEQYQACEALVAMSTAGSVVSWRELGDVDILAIVTVLLKSESEDTSHLATMLLLNLLKLDFREASPALVVALIALLDCPTSFRNQDTKRFASDSLRIIVQARKQKFSASQRSTLEFYRNNSDPVLSGNALVILRLV
jgi:hypothetical protein